jgi:HK97 family phage major capsid protein
MKNKKAVVAYILKKPFGNMAEGEVIHMDQEDAQAMVDAGVLEEAAHEDVNGGEEDAGEEMEAPVDAAMSRAVSRISKDMEKSIVKATEGAVSRLAKPGLNMPSVTPATAKTPVFKCTAEMLLAQVKGQRGDRKALNQLAAFQDEIRLKAPLGSNEGTNTQGGYAVKPEWYKEIWDKVRDYPDLMGRTERISINSNTLNIPALNETSLADGSRHGGVLAYWVSEGAAATSTYPALTQVQSVLNTQVVLVYVTNQLLQDANIEAFDTFINKKVGLEFRWQENGAICTGTGSSQPTGILNQPSLITVAKEAGQAAATIVFPNLAKMYRSLYPGSRAAAVWLVNPETYQQLVSMTFPNAAGTYPAFGGLTFNAHDEFPLRIFGKPAVEVMNLPQLGNVGDIILADLSQLITAEHPGIQADVSHEIQFTTLQTAFRFVRRYDVKSPWTAALSAVDGNYSYSPFVTLQSRGT